MRFRDLIITQLSAIIKPQKKTTIQFAKLLKGKTGLEIGGPSPIFRQKSYYPAYLYARQIDGVNFSTNTVWEGNITEGNTYNYLSGYPAGKQYIAEASELTGIENNQYDFLLSSHSLEHIANPLKALKRWNEVLKPGGTLCLILPNKEATFDKERPYTTMDHLVNDLERNVSEHDDTHFDEVIEYHLVSLDHGLKSKEELIVRTKDNYINRCVHHHVFSFETIKQMLAFCGFEVQFQKEIHGINLFTLAVKK